MRIKIDLLSMRMIYTSYFIDFSDRSTVTPIDYKHHNYIVGWTPNELVNLKKKIKKLKSVVSNQKRWL